MMASNVDLIFIGASTFVQYRLAAILNFHPQTRCTAISSRTLFLSPMHKLLLYVCMYIYLSKSYNVFTLNKSTTRIDQMD